MAELQWIIEVKCINVFLGEVKVGEKGENVIVNQTVISCHLS